MSEQYIPRTDSLPWRVCAYFRRLPDEVLSVKDIAIKWSADTCNVATQLNLAVENGLLSKSGAIYQAGPKIGAVNLTPVAALKADKPMPERSRHVYTDFDIEAAEPKPLTERPPKVIDRWVSKMKAMAEGTFIDAPKDHAHALRSAATEVRKSTGARVRVLDQGGEYLRIEKHASKGDAQ